MSRSRQSSAAARQGALVRNFAEDRRGREDVFWLKENAEILNVLETTGAMLGPEALALHQPGYEQLEARLGFFPQYYRFHLSMCLDLEDLGFGGDKGARLAEWVAAQGLAEAELSDLQRAEARRVVPAARGRSAGRRGGGARGAASGLCRAVADLCHAQQEGGL